MFKDLDSEQKHRLAFGLKAGVNIANVSQGGITTQSITSFHIGGVMEALYNDKIAIQPEIIYSVQGFDYMENGIERKFDLSYVNVPVMIKYYIFKGITIEAGPQIGFLNTAKLTMKTNDDSDTRDIKDGLRPNDLSFNLGFGFQMNSGLNFNARYSYGLTNIANRLADEKYKNRVIQFSVGYFF